MCARFLHDQSKIVLLHESGTYGVSTGNGVWIGQVQSHSITENQNVIPIRYLGNANRNVAQQIDGPLDIEGTVEFFPQDWRLLGFALGSIATTSGTAQADNYQHTLNEVNSNTRHSAFTSGTFNPFISFTLEESRTGNVANKNFVRTIKGVNVNTYNLSIEQGNPITCEVGFLAQSGSWFSGATTAVTAGSNRPYLWSDATFSFAGTTQESVKSFTFNLNNNFEGPHYINGSRVIAIPYPLNRDYTVEVAQDLTDVDAGSLYNIYFQGGSLFNARLTVSNTQNTGSHVLLLTFSGCRITTMEVPGEVEGVSEVSYTFVPGSVSAIAHDRLDLYTPF